jgi:hypothetical protein
MSHGGISRQTGIYGDYEVICPYCGYDSCDAEFIGGIQATPFFCSACNAYEIGPHDKHNRKLSKVEIQTGWYLLK